jgi:PAS domain S-box-containing protein
MAKDGHLVPFLLTGVRFESQGRLYLMGIGIEIGDRIRAEETIRREKQLSESIINSLPAIFYLFDDRGNIHRWNRTLEQVTGYSGEEIQRMSPLDFIRESDRDLIRNGIQTAFEQGSVDLEANVACKNGEKIPHRFIARRIELNGQPFLLGVGIDILERKRAEEAFRREKTFSDAIIESLPGTFYVIDEADCLVRGNRAMSEIMGVSPEQLAGLSAVSFIHPEDQPATREQIAESRIHGSGEIEARIVFANGTVRHCLFTGQRMDLGNARFVVGTGFDITDRIEAEAALRESEQRLRQAQEMARLGYWKWNTKTGDVEWSDEVYRIFGLNPKEFTPNIDSILSRSPWPEYHNRGEELLRHVMASRDGGSYEQKFLRPDNSIGYYHSTYQGRYDEAGNLIAIVGTVLDITERKLAEEELKTHKEHLEDLVKLRTDELVSAKDAAEAANRAKSDFLATISHEIRTPMTAILGYADLLMDPTLEASTRNNYATTIHRSGEHLLALINDILDLSKIEAGKVKMLFERCSLVALLADVKELLLPRTQKNCLAFSVEYAGPIPEAIYSDGDRLRQAIINLAGNAIKFTEKGGVRIVATFLPATAQKDASIRIDISDTGIGIPPETMANLFRPFTQGDPLVTRKYGGTGLGLVISHHIAKLLGGDLTATSEQGKGSTFSLTIPTGSLDGVTILQNPGDFAIQEADRTKPWTSGAADLTGVRILLAEDGIDNRELIETLLQHVGAIVETAENGRIAVEKTQGQAFDLILMDMNMPEMDGYEATRVLRDRGYSGPIVALTANAMIGDSERCLEAGCDGYLTKPIDRKRLIQLVAASIHTTV